MVEQDSPERGGDPAAMKPLWGYVWAVINAGTGVMLLSHVGGWIDLDTRAGPALLGVVGGGLLLLGVYVAFIARANARRGDRPQNAAERATFARATAMAGTVALLMLTFTMTTIAVYAWLPEQAGAFSGGITGSVWETRIVWGVVALLLDAFCVAALVGAWRRRGRS